MAITQLAVGLKKQDFNDPGWHTGLNSGFDDADTRLRRTQAGNPNGVLQSHWIGQLCWDTTNKRLYVATNVANPGAWEELSNFLGPITFNGAATFAASPVNFNVRPTLAAGVTLSSGQTLQVPAGENWLTDGVNAFQAHLHRDRHENMTGAGSLHDFVRGRIIAASIAGPISYDASGRIPADAGSGSGDGTVSDSSPLPIVLTANTSHDFSARRVGQTSRVLHEADISTVFGADNYLRYMNWALYMDGSVIAATIQKISGRAAGADGPFSLFTSGAAVSGKIVFLQTAISHASHTWNLRVHSKDASIGGGFGLHVGVKLSSFDLGIE